MLEQSTRPVPWIVLGALRSEVRSGAWIWMAAGMFCAAAIVQMAEIPFWSEAVSATAVLGVNIGICAITIAISTRYDASVHWVSAVRTADPVIRAAAASASRIAVAVLAATIAIGCQGIMLVASPGTESSDALHFVRSASALAAWLILVLAPWSVLARLALGRLAAPWAVLALVVLGAWTANSEKWPTRALEWALPPIPGTAAPRFLADPSSWLYAALHAATVVFASAPFLRHARRD